MIAETGRDTRHTGGGFPVSDDGRPLSVSKRVTKNNKQEVNINDNIYRMDQK